MKFPMLREINLFFVVEDVELAADRMPQADFRHRPFRDIPPD